MSKHMAERTARDRGRPAPAHRVAAARSGRVSRLLDRYVGSLLLGGMGVLRGTVPLPREVRTIAVSVLGAIGDTLIAGAIIQDLRRAFPAAHLTLIAAVSNRAVAPLLPGLDSVITVPVNRPDRSARMVRAGRFDILVDCNQWMRISALHAAWAGCFTVGFRTQGQMRHFAYDGVADHLATRHELENFRALLAPLGVAAEAMPAVALDGAARAAVAPLLRGDGQAPSAGLIVFHPWAGGSNAVLKEWPAANWIKLGAALKVRNYRVAITGGPADAPASQALVAQAARAGLCFQSLAGTLPLQQVAALLAGATAVVAVNTGIMHLASAVDAPLVALNGPTNPDRWGPLSRRSVSLTPVGMAGGYLHLGFEFPRSAPNCMAGISPETVLDAVLRVIGPEHPAAFPLPLPSIPD